MLAINDVQQEAVVCVSGLLRAPTDEAVPRRVEALLRGGARHIVLNLARVSDIDAAGLGQLVRASNLARAADGDLRIVEAAGHTWTMLARTGLVNVLHASRNPRPSPSEAAPAEERV